MTGFGRATCQVGHAAIGVEVASVNHRYLDISIRLPGEWSALDTSLRETVRARLVRGKINISINRKLAQGCDPPLRLDELAAQRYLAAGDALAAMMGSGDHLSIDTLAQLEGVFVREDEEVDLELLRETLENTLNEALDHLDTMRSAEGARLAEHLVSQFDEIQSTLAAIETRLPELESLYIERLRERIRELSVDTDFAEERLMVEVAMMAERGDVTEEIVRLKSHLDQARAMVRDDNATGRRLNFLSQEIQREINTLGSKVRDTAVTRDILSMKAGLEKIREQVQNVE